MAEANILVISDNSSLCYHAQKDLTRENFNVIIEENITFASNILKSGNFDIVLVSVEDNNLEESSILYQLRDTKLEILVIVISDNYSPSSINSMLRLGIFDFIPSSFEPKNLLLRVKQAVLFKRIKNSIKIHDERIQILDKQIASLNNKVKDGVRSTSALYKNLQESYVGSIKALAQAIDMRDQYTYSHSENVTRYATIIAEEMKLSFQELKDIRDACELHDIGKIGIRDSILSKKADLTDDEWVKMREHPLKGAQILKHLGLKNVVELVSQHHEHYDGSGYPYGKKADAIPLGARIISLADAYDAMLSNRAYKQGSSSEEEAITEIKKHSGKQFDPRVVEAFLKSADRF